MAASLRERWRRPPRLRTVGAADEERHATWLELFFDLVFVICIAVLLVVHVAVEMALRHRAAGEAPPEVPAATGPTLP